MNVNELLKTALAGLPTRWKELLAIAVVGLVLSVVTNEVAIQAAELPDGVTVRFLGITIGWLVCLSVIAFFPSRLTVMSRSVWYLIAAICLLVAWTYGWSNLQSVIVKYRYSDDADGSSYLRGELSDEFKPQLGTKSIRQIVSENGGREGVKRLQVPWTSAAEEKVVSRVLDLYLWTFGLGQVFIAVLCVGIWRESHPRPPDATTSSPPPAPPPSTMWPPVPPP